MNHPAELVVLQSVPQPRPTTNPYVILLADSLNAIPGVTVKHFSWATALFGRYDVFHVHWPEILVGGQSRLKTTVRQGLFWCFLIRLKLTRTPMVRTVHNLDRPARLTRRQNRLLDLADDITTLRIRLNDFTPIPDDAVCVTIPHGHYRDWYAAYERCDPERGRLAFFGFVRRYKGIDGLVRAFKQTKDASAHTLSLSIAGQPTSAAVADEIEELANGDDRITLRLSFLDDAGLVRHVTRSILVVLPYRDMHNSGGVLAALSLDRPVLVPDNDANRALAAEVGSEWLITYPAQLTSSDLLEALEQAEASTASSRPDLSARDWGISASLHVDAYRTAIGIAGR
ncbi:MAG: glycosyltransferase [Candidatus Nanopelagicales bacterium]